MLGLDSCGFVLREWSEVVQSYLHGCAAQAWRRKADSASSSKITFAWPQSKR